MNDTPGAPSPQTAPRKASPIRIILMLALGGPVLAVGGCALFLANVSFGDGGGRGNDNLSALGAIVFGAGCLAFLVGIVWALARAIDRRFAKAKAASTSSTASTASTSRTASTSTSSTASTSTSSTASTSTSSTVGTPSTSSTDRDT